MKSLPVKFNKIIILGIVIAILLTMMPLPHLLNWLRPEWLLLFIITCNLIKPSKIGLVISSILGFWLDIIQNTVLGEHALIFLIVSYLVIKFQTRIYFFPFWQKLSIIFELAMLSLIIQYTIESWVGHPITSKLYWLSAITTTMVWPIIMLIMENKLSRKTKMQKVYL